MASEQGLALQFCNSFSTADLQRLPTAITAIRERNLLVVGSPGHLATYDAVNSVRHAQFIIPRNHTPTLLHVLPSKADVVIVCKEWTVYVQPLRPAKCTLVMDLSNVKKKPLTDALLTSMPASSSSGRLPVLFVAAALKDSVRSAYLLPQAGDKGKVSREMQPGFKLNLEKGKGIVALASHPFAPVLTVLTVNGELQLYQHTQGAATLTPVVQYTMLLEESKAASPLVAGAYLSEVLTAEISAPLNALIAVAGNAVDGKYVMRAWTILGDEGCSLDGLKLQPRYCSQNINQLEASSDTDSVAKQPDWAQLWTGNTATPAASLQGSLLDLTTVVYANKPSMAAAVVPSSSFVMTASNMLMVQYVARSAQKTPNYCPVALFRFVNMDHPTQNHPAYRVAAMHTTPLDWRVQDVDSNGTLTFPHRIPYLNEHAVCAYSMASKTSTLVENVPQKDSMGRWLTPDQLVFSRLQHVGFVFCSLAQEATRRCFMHIDFGSEPPKTQVVAKSFFQGVMGTFIGASDAHFMVLENRKIGEDNFALYSVSGALSEDSLAGYTYIQLDTGDCCTTVWPGPPAHQLLEEAEFDEAGNIVEREAEAGLGLAVVGTMQGLLMLVLVPDVSHVSEDDELLPCVVHNEMQLLDGERLCQVAWNTMVHRTQVGYASHCSGAVLTSQRVIVTDGALGMLQSVAVAEPGAAVPHIITSVLWVGPALLMSHASGRVEHVTPSGKRMHVCSLARIGSYVLAGVTADSVVLLHSRGPAWLITARKLVVGSILMQTWLGMLAQGHAYGTWPNVRHELQLLVKHFNVRPASDVALAEALLTAGCGDLLREYTEFINTAGINSIAHAAASNDWKHAADQVLKVRSTCEMEYHRSAYAPCAPPEASQLRQQLITVSLGAMSQGKWHDAERCLQVSGETLLLMLLHALQHNRAALQRSLNSGGAASPMHTLAMLLLAADARIGLRQPLQADWHLSRPVQDTDASTWEFATAMVPEMRAQADRSIRFDVVVPPGEEGVIAPWLGGNLTSHLGLTHGEVMINTSTPAPAQAPAVAQAAGDEEEEEVKLTPEEEEAARVRDNFLEQFEGDSMFMSSGELAQRAAGDEESGLISLVGSDDEGGDIGDLHARNLKRAARQRKKQAVKDTGIEDLVAGEAAAEARKSKALGPEGSVPMGMAKKAAAAAAGQVEDAPADVWDELGLLKPEQLHQDAQEADEGHEEDDDPFAAFNDMALPTVEAAPVTESPPLQQVASSEEKKAVHDTPSAPPAVQPQVPQTASHVSTAQSSQTGNNVEALGNQGAASDDATSQQPPGIMDVNAGNTAPAFLMGVHHMYSGQWKESLQAFAQAYQVCTGMEKLQVGQYIAAVSILEGYNVVPEDQACRLSRFAASLPLLLVDHAWFLVQDAVGRNMRAGNATWSIGRLESFLALCQAKGQSTIAQAASLMLQQARAVGAGNRSVPTDEATSNLVEHVNVAETPLQIYTLCTRLRTGLF